MKKRYIWAGAVLWALGSGFIVLHMAQGDVEGKIKQWLAVHSCSAEDVKFSLLSGELKVKGITLEYDEGGHNITGRVESALLSGLHRGAFDAENGDLTPLADDFVMEGITFERVKGEEKYEGRIKSLYGKGWYENLATGAQAMLEDKSMRTLLEQLRRYRVDELTYEGYEVKMPVSMPLPDGSLRVVTMVSNIDKVSLPDGIGFKPGEEKGELRVSAVGEGFTMEMPGWMSARMAKIELRDVYMPETDKLLALLEVSERLDARSPSEADLDEYMDKLLAAWEGHLPFGLFRLESMECTYGPEMKDVPGWSLEELACTLDNGARSEAGLSMKGMRSQGLDQEIEREVRIPAKLREKFLPQGLVLDASTQVSLAVLSGESEPGENASEPDTVTLTFGIRGLGRTHSVFEVLLEKDSGTQNLSDLKKMLMNAMVGGANLEYTDEGFMPLAFELCKDSSGQSAAALKSEIVQLAESLQKEMGILGLSKAVGIMVDKPGVLKISCMLEEPVPLAALGLFVLGTPEGREVMANAQPGEKTLEELLQ